MTSYRVSHHDHEKNEEGLRLQLDLFDEARATMEQRMGRY